MEVNQHWMKQIDSNGIGALIRGMRIKRGLSQVELAKRGDVTQSRISEWEAGKVNISLDSLVLLANALDCTVEILMHPVERGGRGKLK